MKKPETQKSRVITGWTKSVTLVIDCKVHDSNSDAKVANAKTLATPGTWTKITLCCMNSHSVFLSWPICVTVFCLFFFFFAWWWLPINFENKSHLKKCCFLPAFYRTDTLFLESSQKLKEHILLECLSIFSKYFIFSMDENTSLKICKNIIR